MTGELIEYDATEHVYEDFSGLVVSVPSHAEKALILYEDSFEMKVHWAKEFKDDGIETYYELVYLPVFDGTGGHIHFINAHTMELWIADTDGLEVF